MDIGFIGLGRMGAGMAGRLIKAGHRVSVYNRTPEKVRPLVEMGAQQAADVAQACRAGCVVTMLSDDPAVEAMALGEHGVVKSTPRGGLHISSSTISPALSKRLARAHAEAGQLFVAAPVIGRPDVAAAGKLFVLAAGEPAAIEKARPALDSLGQRTFPLPGPAENANLIKLSCNFLIAAVIEGLGEALALVGKGGVDPKQYIEILTSSLFDVPVYKIYGSALAARAFEPPGFSAPLGAKDIRLALAAADDLRVPLPLASLLRDRFLTLFANGGDNLDWAAIGALAAKDAGLPA
jgi:3-hydroxyisobutyrate dehydrogenase-like beta-hydroxyacid dehydrogenase